jgi:hypothetical protein
VLSVILKSRIAKTLMLLAYLALFGEVFIRFTNPQPLLPRYVSATDYGVRGNIPNASYWHLTPEVTVQMRINAAGMRSDREYEVAKPNGMCRLALFGDSFFMGYELDLKDTFASRLEEELRKKGNNIEVLNFSVSGFGTAEMIRKYEADARRYSPDIVMFELHESDVADNLRSNLFDYADGKVTETKRNYLPAADVQDFLQRIPFYSFIADRSHLYSFIRERASRAIRLQMVKIKAFTTEPAKPTDATNQSTGNQEQFGGLLTRALFDYESQLLKKEGRDFYVIEIPTFYTRTKILSVSDLLTTDQQKEMHLISPESRMLQVANEQTQIYYERGHRHLTPLGVNLLVAAALEGLQNSIALKTCGK